MCVHVPVAVVVPVPYHTMVGGGQALMPCGGGVVVHMVLCPRVYTLKYINTNTYICRTFNRIQGQHARPLILGVEKAPTNSRQNLRPTSPVSNTITYVMQASNKDACTLHYVVGTIVYCRSYQVNRLLLGNYGLL